MAVGQGARINTNIGAMNALNALNGVNKNLGVSQLRLATGKRINSASDDASGYVMSKKMTGRISSLNAALDNIGDAQNVLSIAEGAYAKIGDIVTQVKEKQARFQNGGLSTAEQDAITSEIKQMATEIDNIVAQTKFNGKALIDGSFSAGVANAGTGTFAVGDVAAATGTVTSIDVSGAKASETYTLSSTAPGKLTLTRASDSVSQEISISASAIGTEQSYTFSDLGVSFKMMGTAVATSIVASAALVGAGTTIITGAATSASFQVGDTGENFSLSFAQINTAVAGNMSASEELLGTAAANITNTTVSTMGAQIDVGLSHVLGKIGDIGAQMNRLSAKEENLTNAVVNTEAARSRILDADIAKEQISASKLQILQQTATASLAQANQSGQAFLSLFR
ncbi:MAG TPA: flagellin [Bacteroidota bacterium]|nr:flagellin [Bacteroidota bacterium]